jgi:hypothetical protein
LSKWHNYDRVKPQINSSRGTIDHLLFKDKHVQEPVTTAVTPVTGQVVAPVLVDSGRVTQGEIIVRVRPE